MVNKRNASVVPSVIPEEVPRLGNAVTRAVGRGLLRLLGWKVVGELPPVRKAVFAAAPHTSNWDFLVAMAAVMAMGLKISYLMKKEAFFWPFKDVFMSLGGIPIDRKAAVDTVQQIKTWFAKEESLWVVITPEGTRSYVKKWKTGFLRVAEQSSVPVVLVAWDYPSKTMHIDKLWRVGCDHDKDAEEIRHYLCSKYTGCHPEKQ